jgi:large subunit ribosomal protein L29
MKASELRALPIEELPAVAKRLEREIFDARMKNHTNRLDDTASIRKAKRDLARVHTVMTQRAAEAAKK